MLRISSVFSKIYKVFSYKLLFLLLLVYKICNQELLGGVISLSISGDDHLIYDSTESSNRIFSINPGTGGSITLKSGIFDARDLPENFNAVIAANKTSQPTGILKDYTINIATTIIASPHNSVINMGYPNVNGNITIINGYTNPYLNLGQNGSYIYRTSSPPDQTAHPINYGTVINFKDSGAKLNLIQNNSELNRIHGDIQGSNNGDNITLNGGSLLGRIILGTGNNNLTMANNACIDVSQDLMVDQYAIFGTGGNNNIDIKDQARIISGNHKEAIYVDNASNGISTINITGTPEIIGGINLPPTANILNIGTSKANATYSTTGDLTNLQTIELNTPANAKTLFTINNDINGLNKFTIRYNTTAKIQGGHVRNDGSQGSLINYGNLSLSDLANIYGLGVNNQSVIEINNNSTLLFNNNFENTGNLNLYQGGDLSAINPNIDNLVNNYGGNILINENSTIGKLGRLGTITNKGKIIINGDLYADRLINQVHADIVMSNNSTCNINGSGIIDNNSNFYIPKGATVNANVFNQNNDIRISGNVNASMVLGGNGAHVEIFSGKINSLTAGNNNDILSIFGPFSTHGNINNIQIINLVDDDVTIKDPISGVSNIFLVYSNTKVNFIDNGDLSGGGVIDNSGIINITKGITAGSIGKGSSMGNINNRGQINSLGGYVKSADFTNKDKTAALNIKSGSVLVANFNNTLGELNISGGDLSLNTNVPGAGILNNATNQIVNLTNNGTIGNNQPFNQIVNNGVFNVLEMALVKVNGFNNDRVLNTNNTSVELNIIGGQVLVGNGSNSTSGNTNQIYNTYGAIKIGSSINSDGDLSSLDPKALANLVNGKDQLIIVNERGTIGRSLALGNIENIGKFIANGGDIIVGNFINGNNANNHYAELALNRGVFKSGNITNDLGIIKILNTIDDLGNIYIADLSSAIADLPSSLINSKSQIIDIQTGTIGVTSPLGQIDNDGIINVNNNINVGAFNNKADGKLRITGGLARVGDINNEGNITIETDGERSADLSSINKDLPSKLLNSYGQTINVLGNGSIGLANPLGTVNNFGIINASGGNIIAGQFIQGKLNEVNSAVNFQINSGNVFLGNIENNNQNTIKIQGGDLSSYDPINHSSLINRGGQILIEGEGSVGQFLQSSLGKISNYDEGLFQANGGNISIDNFENGLDNSKLDIPNTNGYLNLKKGVFKTGGLNNIYGTVTIDQADLSASSNYFGEILNATDQNIIINNPGSIGLEFPFYAFNNSGTVSVNGGSVNVGTFENKLANSNLNINEGRVKFKNLKNTLGNIIINGNEIGGDLSGSDNNNGYLVNNSNISIKDKGTLGKINKLGNIDNYGSINAITNIFKANNLNNYNKIILTDNTMVLNSQADTGIYIQNINNQGTIDLNSINKLNMINTGKLHNFPNATCNFNAKLNIKGSLINEENGIININNNFKLIQPQVPPITEEPDLFINQGIVNILQPVSLEIGDYYLGSTGQHVVTINNGNVPVLTLNKGNATIANGATIKINNPNDEFIKDQQKFNIIKVSEPTHHLIASDFSTIKVLAGSSLLSFKVLVDDKNLDITAKRKNIRDIIEPAHGYMLNLAASLDRMMENNTNENLVLKEILADLQNLSTEQEVISALNQLYPELGLSEIALASNTFAIAEITENRMDFLAKNNSNNVVRRSSGYSAGSMNVEDGFWIKGLASNIKQSDRNNYSGYNANTGGLALGLDTKFLEDFWVGLGFSKTITAMKSKDYPSKKTTLNSYQITAYASFNPEPYYINLFASFAVNNYKTRRDILFTTPSQVATADFKGFQPGAKLNLGYSFQFNNFKLTPIGSLQYSVLFQSPYNENPVAIIGLNHIASDRLTQLEMGLGVKLGFSDHYDPDQLYNYDVHFMYLHDFKAVPRITSAEFVGGSSFKIAGATPDRKTYNFGLGFNFKYQNRLQLNINYDLRKKNKFIGHGGSITVRYDL